MQYLKIARQIINENIPILVKYWWIFLSISLLYHVYQYLILRFINISPKYFFEIISLYHVLLSPIISLIIMYIVDCYNKSQLPVGFNKLMQDAKRCYIRILLIYLIVYLIRRYFGLGATLISFIIIYIKLPFLEQEIFFKNSSLWKAIKRTNELTNREATIKVITILVLMFLVVYLTMQKTSHIILSYDIQYKQMILNVFNILQLTFFLFCKAVLTKVYSNIKYE